jgi:CheY-like chemotaxis protein
LRLTPAPVLVCGDRTRLVQVLANILNNAAKYTQEEGELRLDVEADDKHVRIAVRDNGIGMAPELVARAFDLFAQAERSADRASGGLGLGLALVKNLVELHGGTVSCDSPGLGHGSRFVVSLPRLHALGTSAQETADCEPATPAALRILVVDDNRDAAEILTMALELSGCETVVAYSAGAALDLAEGFRPQVGLLDIGLPDMTGYELARRLRQLPDCESGLVLIAATGWGQDKDRELAFEAGFDHHLTKPIDFDQLRMLLPRVEPE